MSLLANCIFYDIESSGLDVSFDQILQFYGCRIDEQGQISDECHIHVKGLVDCVPDIAATQVHGLVPSFDHGESEFDAMCRIHAFLNTPLHKNGGYNTLGFDDEFIRFSFYRNFLNPYQHQWAQQCSRFDIFPVTALYAILAPDVMTWPMIDGRVSLKLEHLNEANGWMKGQAHDASFDVHVTHRCAEVLAKDSERFAYAMGYFNKDIDKKRSAGYCDTYYQIPYALLFDTRFGYRNRFMKPALLLGGHAIYRNQSLWLCLDEPLWDLEYEEIERKIYRKKLGEPAFVLPPKEPYLSHCQEAYTVAQENLAWLASRASLIKKIAGACVKSYEDHPNVDIDAQLYQLGLISQKQIEEQFVLTQSDTAARMRLLMSAAGSYKSRALRFCLRHDMGAWQSQRTGSCQDYLSYMLGHDAGIFHNHRQKPKRQLPDMLRAVEEALGSDGCDQNLMRQYKAQLLKQQAMLEEMVLGQA